jgi:hypothetical protein
MATKAQRHKEKLLARIYLCDFVSWWRKYFRRKIHKNSYYCIKYQSQKKEDKTCLMLMI